MKRLILVLAILFVVFLAHAAEAQQYIVIQQRYVYISPGYCHHYHYPPRYTLRPMPVYPYPYYVVPRRRVYVIPPPNIRPLRDFIPPLPPLFR